MPRVLTPRELGAPLGMYSHGMAAPGGEIVVVAGQVGMRGSQVAGNDVGSQTRQALANVRAVVEAAGCTMRDVVRLQTFLVDRGDIPGFMKARQDAFPEYFPDGTYPPNTLLVVSGLVRPELLVEIEALAVKAPSRTPPPRTSGARSAAKPARAATRRASRGKTRRPSR